MALDDPWYIEDGKPMPTADQIHPGPVHKMVHGGVLRLGGRFSSWKFDIKTTEAQVDSIDRLFVTIPSATHAWLGPVVLVNNYPQPHIPTPPPTAAPTPTPPTRPWAPIP